MIFGGTMNDRSTPAVVAIALAIGGCVGTSVYQQTTIWVDEATGTYAYRSGDLANRTLGQALGSGWLNPTSFLELYLYEGRPDTVTAFATFEFGDWYFLDRAYAFGRELPFAVRSRRVLYNAEVEERVSFDLQVNELMLLSRDDARESFQVRLSGDFSTTITMSSRSVSEFLIKAKDLGANAMRERNPCPPPAS